MKYDLEDILRYIADQLLPCGENLSDEQLQARLQIIADTFLPLFYDMATVTILIRGDLKVPIAGELQKVDACYYWNTRAIEISKERLTSCQGLPGKWVGLLLHEMTHAYVEHKYHGHRNYLTRRDHWIGHNVWFFVKALAIQAELEWVLMRRAELRAVYGFIEPSLQSTITKFSVLKRRYRQHLERARQRLCMQQLLDAPNAFLLPDIEASQPPQQDSFLQSCRMQDEDEDRGADYSEVYGDVIFCSQFDREAAGSLPLYV